MSLTTVYSVLTEAATRCNDCGACTPQCEVLENSGQSFTVGDMARTFLEAFDDYRGEGTNQRETLFDRVRAIVAERPDYLTSIRRCCMCGFCTARCAQGVNARQTFTVLRELMTEAGLVNLADFNSTKVDEEWHIFSVYRAVYGIYFQDLPHVGQAPELGADTLFFPGCSLASYAPDLARQAYAFLQEQGYNTVFSEECCQSPFKSAGLTDRAMVYKKALVAVLHDAGIKRIVFVCPGCLDEFAEVPGIEGIELIPLPRLMEEAGLTPREDKIRLMASYNAEGAVELSADQLVRVSLFDSCHDREGLFAQPLHAMMEKSEGCILVELPHHGKRALCCGAAGSVSLVDPDLCARRAHRILYEETQAVGSQLLVANCPTCSYTWAAQQMADVADPEHPWLIPHANYLELFFEGSFDWNTVFSQLGGMWSGEYAAWVYQQLV